MVDQNSSKNKKMTKKMRFYEKYSYFDLFFGNFGPRDEVPYI